MANYWGKSPLRMKCPNCGTQAEHPVIQTDPENYHWSEDRISFFERIAGQDISYRSRKKRCTKLDRTRRASRSVEPDRRPSERRIPMKIEARASALLLLATIPAVQAQSDAVAYPSRPIRIIVPLAAGGAIDTIARVMSPQLSARLGQSVIVDNRAGAAETIGTELTARATPDGYTMLMASASFVVSPQLFPVRYDVLKDFTYLTQVTRQPYVLIR